MAPGGSEPPSEAFSVQHPGHPAEALERAFVEITASAETQAQTGVEMEALVAATVAALTVYDMAKGVDAGMEIGEVRLVEKVKE